MSPPDEKVEEEINFVVNGDLYEVRVKSNWTLQYVLHNELGLTGTKELCNEGACGACAVIMEGRPILSCMTLAIECDGKTIETIEGIARANHPLIEAYVKHSCMQCGYCTPGFIVTAKALLDKNPNPTEEEDEGSPCRQSVSVRHISPAHQSSAGSSQ